ncbi:MAG: hypothetical protein ABR505_06290 [Actinomycetota bacterium]
MRPRTLYQLRGTEGLFEVSIAHPQQPRWTRSTSAMEVLLHGGPNLTEITEAEADYVLSCWVDAAESKTGIEPAVTLTGKEISLPEGGPAILRGAPPPPPPLGTESREVVNRPSALSALHSLCDENPETASTEVVWMRPARPKLEQAPVAVVEDAEVRTLSVDEAPLKRSLRRR